MAIIKNTPKKRQEVSFSDIKWMQSELASYAGNKRINGGLISPFDQYLGDKGIRGITKDGEIVCIADRITDDVRLGQISAAYENYQHRQFEELMRSNPELREKNSERVAAILARVRKMHAQARSMS